MSTEKDRSAKKETIALIGGTGDLGFGLALRWARAGEQILIGSRDASKAKDAAERVKAALGPDVSVAGWVNPEAAAQASLVVLTVPFPAQVGILKSIRGSLEGSILIDTTVPLAATLGGKLTRVLGVWQGSAAEQARELAPAATPVLAAFHNLSGIALQDLSATLDCDILICGDDAAAKQRLFPLVKLIAGLRPVDAGGLEIARIVEGLTALLISVNRRNRVAHSGIRITGLGSAP
ncbi:MAG: NADPH-dependent F420 reductase [Acidobacteria bacterium]|nr:NADPH-dependent F420 reductase [Acidobacteriota bacterium]MCZ6752524.1 NADPH-dependent F420 reductase [Acidobacteriota bacterium]